jgi:glutamine synthetase
MSETPISFNFGAELEFYVFGQDGELVADLSTGKFPQKFYELSEEFKPHAHQLLGEIGIYGFDVKQESGPGQFEIQFKPYNDPTELVNKILEFKYLAEKLKAKYPLQISFHPKPLAEHPGSALHIHLSSELFDPYGIVANGGFVHARRDGDNDYVLWAIGGLLAKMRDNLNIFLPNHESLQRIEDYMNAPTKICWGRNNRSVAIRIPDGKPKRLEHRVSGADANPEKVIAAIIEAATYGIQNKINPGEPIWGNAWDKIYDRELLLEAN